jgi:uracil-DNA glycosylase family 4
MTTLALTYCTACPLHLEAKRVVAGEGPAPARYMFVGEGPGEREDRLGKPFVGPAGRVLDHLIKVALGCSREEVYITNAVKHRPPGNRTPKRKEVAACLSHLRVEMEAVQPEVVVALGKAAVDAFTTGMKLGSHHGIGRQVDWYGHSFVLVPWYHPAATLHNPGLTPVVLQDAKALIDRVGWAVTSQSTPPYELISEAEAKRRLSGVGWGGATVYTVGHSPTIGFDTETTSPTRGRRVFLTDEAELIGYSFSLEPGTGWYVEAKDFSAVKDVLENPDIIKVAHNAGFELKLCWKYGVDLQNIEDTKLGAYVLGERTTGLKDLTRRYLGIEPITYEEVTSG